MKCCKSMAMPDFRNSVTDYVDYVSTVLKQQNSCPICHLPLVYCYPRSVGRVFPTAQPGKDLYWLQIQATMRSTAVPGVNIPNSSFLYGTAPNVVNGEYCHYVADTYFPTFHVPLLLQVPAHSRVLYPEPGVYLFPETPRVPEQHRVFRHDLRALLPRGIAKHRMARLENMLSMNGTRYFLACKDCNRSHTSDDQVNFMVNKIYPNAGRDGRNPSHPNNCNMYTLMFDSLAEFSPDGRACILFTKRRRRTWQLEVWLTYCTILFVAQHAKEANNAKYLKQSMAYHSFHYGHRDMGICDFYMSQILCALLYAKYDIDVDFITLHQRFMVQLPMWARNHGKFITPQKSFRCIWKFVAGDYHDDGLASVVNDTATDVGREYYRVGSNCYWKPMEGVKAVTSFFIQKITIFNDQWLRVIGSVIDARNKQAPDSIDYWNLEQHFPDMTFLLELRRMYIQRCGKRAIQELIRLPFSVDTGNEIVMENFTKNPSLENMGDIFNYHCHMGAGELYANLYRVALRRMEAGYFLAVTSNETSTIDELDAKYATVCDLLGRLIEERI